MILQEIVHTCSNPHVARAAVASIGGEFAADFADRASQRNMPAGVLAARLVREFSSEANERDWKNVREAVRGADQPILSGLRCILSQRLREARGAPLSSAGARSAAWSGRSAFASSCCA